MCFVFRNETEISRFWHLYPIGMAALGWATSRQKAKTQLGAKISSVFTVVFFISAVSTPSFLYGVYNLDGAAPRAATPDKNPARQIGDGKPDPVSN